MARIMTAENLSRLDLDVVRERAVAAGFRVEMNLPQGGEVMVAPAPDDGEIEFVLPPARRGDHAARMVDALAAIAIVEDIEAVDLLREMLAAGDAK